MEGSIYSISCRGSSAISLYQSISSAYLRLVGTSNALDYNDIILYYLTVNYNKSNIDYEHRKALLFANSRAELLPTLTNAAITLKT